MAQWDRFDICEAYTLAEDYWGVGGVLRERPSCRRTGKSVAAQLSAMNFRPSAGGVSWSSLTQNGREIFFDLTNRLRLPVDEELRAWFSAEFGESMTRAGALPYVQTLNANSPLLETLAKQVDVWLGFRKGYLESVLPELSQESGMSFGDLVKKAVKWGSFDRDMWNEDAQKRFVDFLCDCFSGMDMTPERIAGKRIDVDAPSDIALSEHPYLQETGRGYSLRLALISGNPLTVETVVKLSKLSDREMANMFLDAVGYGSNFEVVKKFMELRDVAVEGRYMEFFACEVMDRLSVRVSGFEECRKIAVFLVEKFGATLPSSDNELLLAVKADIESESLLSKSEGASDNKRWVRETA